MTSTPFVTFTSAGDASLTTNLPFAATLYRRHEALSQANEDSASALFGRYVGTVAHMGGPGTKTSWELDPSDPAAAWWQYKSQYEQYTA